jgi:twinkle protein
MAEYLSADEIDFRVYTRSTDAAVKVRRASQFADDVKAAFAPRPRGARKAEMFSTKLRSVIEFRPGEVTCWAGYNGHRKSMFAGQVTLDLCVQRERVLAASFEMLPAQTLARMARQAFAARTPTDDQVDHFASWTDGRLWIFDHMGRITPDQCIAVCRYFASEKKGTQIVLDSMMMICASEESLDEQKQFMTDLVRLAQESGLHIHLVAHCRKPQNGEDRPPTKYDLRGSAAISDQAHNIITVWSNKAKRAAVEKGEASTKLSEPDALVTIEKQRNGAWEGRLNLWFDEMNLRFCDDGLSRVEPYELQDATS